MSRTWTKGRRSRACRAGRKAATLALLMAASAGCAVQQGVLVPSRSRDGGAPDLLDVSAIAPKLDAERDAVAQAPRPKPAAPGPVDRSVARTATPATTQDPAPVAGPGMPPPGFLPGQIPGATGTARPLATPMPAGGAGLSPLPRANEPGIRAGDILPPGDPVVSTPEPPSMAAEPRPLPSALAGETPPSIPVSGQPYPIDLPTALRLADDQNPEIGIARVAILAASAQQLAAYGLLLPTLNGGSNYDGHAGNLQRSSGQILNVSRQNAFVGNAGQVVANSAIVLPGVNIFSPLTDAIYQPLATHQLVIGARFNAAATANEVLLDVSTRYLELLGAKATLDSWRRSASEADEIARIVLAYAITGQGRKADADRAETQRRLFQAEIQHAEELVAVASARLSERLNLDASVRLETPPGQIVPLSLVDLNAPTEELIRAAIRQRPDLAARQAEVRSAEFRHKRELARPFLPTVWVSFSGGSQGGGSNIVTPNLGNFGGRADFDARAYWTLLNGGFGNLALQKQQRAEVNEAIATRVRVLNRARDEVTSARAEAIAQRQKVATVRVELASAEDGYREDLIHTRESLGRPIEVLNSLVLLARSRINLIEAITRANQAQFGLWVALGSPPPLGPQAAPGFESSGPPPIPVPLHSPIISGPVPLIPMPTPPPPVLMK